MEVLVFIISLLEVILFWLFGSAILAAIVIGIIIGVSAIIDIIKDKKETKKSG